MADEYGLNLKTLRRQVVQETDRGTYLWQMPNGAYIADGEGHYLMIAGRQGDSAQIKKLAKAVSSLGIDEGHPVFFPDQRPVSDDEWEYQRQRFEWGLTPDPLDIPKQAKDKENGKNRRR